MRLLCLGGLSMRMIFGEVLIGFHCIGFPRVIEELFVL